MLEQLKQMEQAGQWAEIRQLDPALFAGMQGDQLARAYLALSKAWEETALSQVDYRQAISFARRAADLAEPGSFIDTWSSARAAAMLADIGHFGDARRHADVFLAQVANHPKADVMAPWAFLAVARTMYYHKQPLQALAWLRRAQDAGADGAISETIQVWIAWCLAAAGRSTAAFAAIPPEVHFISGAHVLAATARACLAAHDWAGAQLNAGLALQAQDAGGMRPCDFVQAAELYLILKLAATTLGQVGQAAARLNTPAALSALGNRTLVAVLALTLGMKGGEAIEAASSVRGDSDGHKRSGTRGTVG